MVRRWFAALMSASCLATAAFADPLDSHRWTNRVLVAIAPTPDDPRLATQRRLFEAARPGTRERDLALATGASDAPEAASLRRRFGVAREAFRAILVGKDGGAKLSSPEPIPAERLFAEIDTMPMRQEERRRDETRRGKP